MKLFLKIFSLTFLLFVFSLEVYSISNYEILKICRNKRKEKSCVKRLKLNRELIDKGKPIRIPVLPYKIK